MLRYFGLVWFSWAGIYNLPPHRPLQSMGLLLTDGGRNEVAGYLPQVRLPMPALCVWCVCVGGGGCSGGATVCCAVGSNCDHGSLSG